MEQEKRWCVYVHTNRINGKRYVGITSKENPEHRWNHGRGYGENTHFSNAVKKYGWNCFSHDILYRELSEEDAKNIERKLIALWNLKDNRCGYNMTDGGDGASGCYPSQATREKLSAARRRENLSEETLRRRSESLKGRKFSDEHKRKIGAANSKQIEMYDKSGQYIRSFDSAREVEVTLGISHSHISQCCHGKRETSGGYRWKFA